MTQTWTHNGLMNDLAAYLRGPDTMVWEDMQLGPSGSPRPDVYTLRKSYFVNERIAGAKAHEDREYERIRRDVEMHRSILMGQVKQHAAEFEAAKRELADWLGLPADTSVFAVRRAIRDLQASCDADARVRDAEAKLSQARHSIEQALRYVDTAPAGRNAERQDRADGLGPKGEHAVPAQRGGAQPASGNLFDEERAA